jgi:hypothetical protein
MIGSTDVSEEPAAFVLILNLKMKISVSSETLVLYLSNTTGATPEIPHS